MRTRCSLYIRIFRGVRQYNPILGGVDLDNRIKTLIDSLRAPQQPSELGGRPDQDMYVLLEDDSLVDGITVKSDHLLDEDSDDIVLAIVTADIHLSDATWKNLHLGYPSDAY
jgi:hypothetical protein